METPPTQQPAGRQCPRCGAPMTEEQEWCLVCGAAVGTRVVAAPGWRGPLIVAGVIAVIAAVAIAVAIVQLADDTRQVAQTPPATTEATPTPPPATTPVPTTTPEPGLTDPTATPEATATPETTATPESTATPEATATPGAGSGTAEWPSGKSGWTVVLASTTSESSAKGKAASFASDGISGVGVLRSDDFSSLKAGYWVVFAGQYDTQDEARDALDGVDASDAYVRRIAPN
jgi:septal ring-binding cell division protein DamX